MPNIEMISMLRHLGKVNYQEPIKKRILSRANIPGGCYCVI